MPDNAVDMSHSPDQAALLAAFRRLLLPLASLAVSRGLPFSALDELLRQVVVQAAAQQQERASGHGAVSRISMATGLSRREVGRILESAAEPPPQPRWLVGEVFARWTNDPLYAVAGHGRSIPRKGAAPSFEALAQSVTRDVHPRSLLEELVRLGLAQESEDGTSVQLLQDSLVPRQDFTKMMDFLTENVGDHLSGAAHNVLGQGDPFLEQAVAADELSSESVEQLRPVVLAQWTALRQALVPALEALIEQDRQAGRTQGQRVRIGLYSYAAPMESGLDS